MYHQHRHSLGEKMAAASRLRRGRAQKNRNGTGCGTGASCWVGSRGGGGRKENQSMLFELCGGGRYSSLPHIFLCPPAPTYGGGSCIYYSFFAPHFASLLPPLLQKVALSTLFAFHLDRRRRLRTVGVLHRTVESDPSRCCKQVPVSSFYFGAVSSSGKS